MKLYYKDEEGTDRPYYMGCYGIGLGRIIATLIENNIIYENDKLKGFILPKEVAPYKVQIIYKEDKKDKAEELYNYLEQNNIKCIIDDRENMSIGTRIKDVFVLGTPYTIVLGDRTTSDNFEVEENKTGIKNTLTKEEIRDMFTK